MKLLLSILIVTGILAACNSCARHVVIASPPYVPAPDGSDVCSVACAKLRANHCLGIVDDAGEANCVSHCADDQAVGQGRQLAPEQIVSANTIEQLQAIVPDCQGVPVGSAAPSEQNVGTSRQVPTEAHCHALGGLPDKACTPGNVETTDLNIICHQSTKERRNVSSAVHRKAFAEYGIEYPQPTGAYEVDHLIPLELGGSNDIKNLWPQPASPEPGFHTKDKLESALHRAVCSGQMKIEDAQHAIATDWIAAQYQVNR